MHYIGRVHLGQNLLSMVQHVLNKRHVVRGGAAVEKTKAAIAVTEPQSAENKEEGEVWSRHRHNINFRQKDRTLNLLLLLLLNLIIKFLD